MDRCRFAVVAAKDAVGQVWTDHGRGKNAGSAGAVAGEDGGMAEWVLLGIEIAATTK